MKITITGPRSVGKSTVSKILAIKLKLKYIDGDAEMDNALIESSLLNLINP